MRHIQKQGFGGYHLEQANNNPPTTSDQATSRWSSFKHKDKVSGYLNTEQYGLCAYSEIRPDEFGLNTHIEHIEPKSKAPLRTFDYSNIVLNALSSDDLATMNSEDVFGGHAKLSEYDDQLFVSCLQADCSRYFSYLSNGQVEPSHSLDETDRKKAKYSIDLLNLNCPYLVTQRKKWLDELDQLIDEHIENDMSLPDLASIDLIPTANKLSQYFTATRQRFGDIAEQVLQAQAPELV